LADRFATLRERPYSGNEHRFTETERCQAMIAKLEKEMVALASMGFSN
jgi:hypothetical protein